MILGNKWVVARVWGGVAAEGVKTAGYLVKGHCVFWGAVVVYDPLRFMETTLLDLSFDANWRIPSSGAKAYGQEAPQ